MRILVTGAAGYIGSTLVDYLLKAGHTVWALDNFCYNNSYALSLYYGHPNFDFTNMDMPYHGDSELQYWIQNAHVIIPLAALVGAPVCDANPEMAKQINYEAIRYIVDNARSETKIIYPNTNSGYGIKDGVCTEEDELNPISLYGKTKCDAEKYVLANHENSVVLRLATVFGASPRMRFDLMVNNFFYTYYNEGELTVFEPHFRRNFVHVKDVARGFMYSLDKNVRGVYNLGNDNLNCTKMELAEGIAWWLHTVGEISGEPCIKVGEGKDKDQRDYNVSSQKIRDHGFNFQYDFDNGFPELYSLVRGMTYDQFKEWGNV